MAAPLYPTTYDTEAAVPTLDTKVYKPEVRPTETWQFIALFLGVAFPIFWIAAAVAPAREATAKRFRKWNRWMLLVLLAEIAVMTAYVYMSVLLIRRERERETTIAQPQFVRLHLTTPETIPGTTLA